jgi:hypothetical protein
MGQWFRFVGRRPKAPSEGEAGSSNARRRESTAFLHTRTECPGLYRVMYLDAVKGRWCL